MDNIDDLITWCDLMAWRYRIGKDGPNYHVPTTELDALLALDYKRIMPAIKRHLLNCDGC